MVTDEVAVRFAAVANASRPDAVRSHKRVAMASLALIAS
jgi:hypothetical protein